MMDGTAETTGISRVFITYRLEWDGKLFSTSCESIEKFGGLSFKKLDVRFNIGVNERIDRNLIAFD